MTNPRALLVCIGGAVILAALRFWQLPISSPGGWDAYLSTLHAAETIDRTGLWHSYQQVAMQIRTVTPGWFPVANLPLVLWLLGPSAGFVKLVQYALVVASFGFFAFVAGKLLRSHAAAIFAVVAALVALQFRTIHDPVVGTSLLEPFSATVILAAFAAWLHHRDSGSRIALALAAAAVALSALTGTIGCALGIVLVIVALRSSRRTGAYIVAGTLLVAIGAVVVRMPPTPPWAHSGGYAWNVFAQLFAALPASFRTTGNLPVASIADLYAASGRYIDDRFIFLAPITIAGWIAALACAVAAYVATTIRKPVEQSRNDAIDAVLFGLGFLVLPALLLGRAGEWQGGLPFGQAFGGAYFQYFGFGVLAALAVWRIRAAGGSAASLVPSVAALAVFLVAYGNGRADSYVLDDWATRDIGHQSLVEAGGAGFLAALPPTVAIVPLDSVAFVRGIDGNVANASSALAAYSGRRFAIASLKGSAPPDPQTWLLDASRNHGFKVTLVRWSAGLAREPLSDRAIGYATMREIAVTARHLDPGVSRTVAKLRSGFLVDARRLCGPVPIAQVFASSTPVVAFGDGFYRIGPVGYAPPVLPLQWGTAYVRTYPPLYMDSFGTADLEPGSCAPESVRVLASVVSNSPSHLTVEAAGYRRTFDVSATPSLVRIGIAATTQSPIHLTFRTDAPKADWDTMLFRYERDRPRSLHLFFLGLSVSERLPSQPRRR